MFERLQPHSEWNGGRLAYTDLLTLEIAAMFASKHAGEEITVQDFLLAAGRGEITLRAIVQHSAKVRKHDGGVLFNKGTANENIVPAGSIPTLPLTACLHLATTGRASWRTFDSFEKIDGQMMRYTKGALTDDEPDFETVPDDCRVMGYDVHALADEYCATENAPQPASFAPFAPVVTETENIGTSPPQKPLSICEPASLLKNSAKKARRDLLTPVIEAAQKDCGNPFDTPSVWASLVRMVNAETPPLVGVTEEGLKWKDPNDELQFFSIRSLRSRLRRSAERHGKAR